MITFDREDIGGIMGKILALKKVAKERGMTLASIAKRLGIYRSNMSAIASGVRGVSLDVLERICLIVDSSIDELILPGKAIPIYRSKRVARILEVIEQKNCDGLDKTWVNRIMLSQKAHYRSTRKAA